jgi:hypothetical protein
MNPPASHNLILEIIFIVFFLFYCFAGMAWQTNPAWPARNGFILALLIGILGWVVFNGAR